MGGVLAVGEKPELVAAAERPRDRELPNREDREHSEPEGDRNRLRDRQIGPPLA
jgi:hypothetical protein